MNNTAAPGATVKPDKIRGKSPKVKPLSHADIRHLYIDLDLTNRRLAARLAARGLKVSGAYVGMLLRKKSLGTRPFGRLVLKAIAEELGVTVEQIQSEEGGGEKS